MALVLAPEAPVMEWLASIDQQVGAAGTLITGWPVVLDLSAVTLSNSAIGQLVSELENRGIRIMGIENVDPAQAGPNLPQLVRSSRAATADQAPADPPANGARQDAAIRQDAAPRQDAAARKTRPCIRSRPRARSRPRF